MTDELKPVHCGCGGEAKVEYWVGRWYVRCQNANCLISTKNCDTEAEAITAWNRAMSAGKDDIAIAKGTWMMTLDGFHCSVCFYKCETTALPDVCPHCGAKMKG